MTDADKLSDLSMIVFDQVCAIKGAASQFERKVHAEAVIRTAAQMVEIANDVWEKANERMEEDAQRQ